MQKMIDLYGRMIKVKYRCQRRLIKQYSKVTTVIDMAILASSPKMTNHSVEK